MNLTKSVVFYKNEPQYRYVLNLIIIVCYIVNVILLESIIDRWPNVVGCITYFIIDNRSVSLAQSYAAQIDDISCWKFLRFLRVIFIGLIIVLVIMLVVFAFFLSSFFWDIFIFKRFTSLGSLFSHSNFFCSLWFFSIAFRYYKLLENKDKCLISIS